MSLETQAKLSPYWTRIVNLADTLLSGEIAQIKEMTIDPSLCLTDGDKFTMITRQRQQSGLLDIQATVRSGSLAGKLWALDAVLRHSPLQALPRL